MNRSTLDRLLSSAGLIVAGVFLAGSVGLFWTYSFIHQQVTSQLAAEQVYFPKAGTPSLTSLPDADQSKVSQYAGQQLLNGSQAEVFADHYIAVHLKKIGGGQTYAQLSSASIADPTNQKLSG